MNQYRPEEWLNCDSQHVVRLKFLYDTLTAEVITTMGGNVCGGELLGSFTDLACGLTAPTDEKINKKYCRFEDEDSHYSEVEAIRFYHPRKGEIEVDLEDVQQYLIGVEIIDYKENVVRCDHCGKKIEENGDDDFHFEVPAGLYPAPYDQGKGVCERCWIDAGYREKYQHYHNNKQIVTFIDDKDAKDAPELTLGAKYNAIHNDGQLVDICDNNRKIGTYCVERFAFEGRG